MSFDLDDVLFEFPDLQFFSIEDLEDLDEEQIQDLIDEFDNFDSFEIPSRLKNNINDIVFSDQNKEKIMQEYNLTETQFQEAKGLKIKINIAENQAKTKSSDSGMKAINQGTLSNSSLEVQLVTRRDDIVCPICEDVDGDVFEVDPVTRIIDGPLIPDDLHPNCRCRYMNMLDEEIVLG